MAGAPREQEQPVVGDVRVTKDGMTQIRGRNSWVNYPADAAAIIKCAVDHGWFVDDGLPTRVRYLTDAQSNTQVFISVRVARPAHEDRYGNWIPCEQFHVVFYMNVSSWQMDAVHYKLGTGRDARWMRVDLPTLFGQVESNPRTVPSPYMDEMEYRTC